MSGCVPCQSVEDKSKSGENCYISYLPSETLTQVFSYLSAEDLVACVKTCTLWREIINSSERIWRSLCMSLTESFANIRQDRLHGFSWRVTYQRHYGLNGIKQLWKEGVFSHPAYQQLPDRPFCSFDANTWGQILQWELDRN